MNICRMFDDEPFSVAIWPVGPWPPWSFPSNHLSYLRPSTYMPGVKLSCPSMQHPAIYF